MKIVDGYEFIFFLQWLDQEKNWTASEIICVVEKPNCYQKQYDEYKNKDKEKK